VTPVQHETSFDYTIYVAASPERIWRALTDPADTPRYWRHREAGGKTFPSDWKAGSCWELVHADIGLVVSDPAMVILESDPPRRLSYTWHTFTPEWAAAVGLDPEEAATWRAEPRSKVAFDLEETAQGVTRLTVVHHGFAAGSVVLPNIAQGWPAVCSSLKSMVETGSPLP
jgi:uncharacterized protein YndB with AHSA1/START domain